MSSEKHDLEAPLYPSMQESPQLRWAFIRKVYSILTLQLVATIAIAAIVVSVRPIANFFNTTRIGVAVFIVILIIPIIVAWFLYIYRNKHPLNFILLGIFTLCFGLGVGAISAFVDGKIIIEAATATTVVVISLTLYTFWASRRGLDFGFLVPFLLSTLLIIITFTIFQIFFPLGKISEMLYNGLFVIIFSAYIIFDTDDLIKRNNCDQYIWASVSLYLDVLNLFTHFLGLFRAADR